MVVKCHKKPCGFMKCSVKYVLDHGFRPLIRMPGRDHRAAVEKGIRYRAEKGVRNGARAVTNKG